MPYEFDFLPVGDAGDSGDAIAMRFTHPTTGAWTHVVIDAGFKDDGEALVDLVQRHYGSTRIDLAILTHPDGDHIGGMGEVIRHLDVERLWLHHIARHGGSALPAANAVSELIALAHQRGTIVEEAWAGDNAFDGALTILGPDEPYYDWLVTQQVGKLQLSEAYAAPGPIAKVARGLFDRIDRAASRFGVEIPFGPGDVTPRNESSMITLLEVDGRASLFTGDAGVEALDRALGQLRATGRSIDNLDLQFVQIPHHGSRRNGSSEFLTRLLGPPGRSSFRTAFVSCVAESEKHPSGRIVNAFGRRGCEVYATAGQGKRHFHETPYRAGSPATPLGPMVEEEE